MSITYNYRTATDAINAMTDPGGTLQPNQVFRMNGPVEIPNDDNGGIYYPVHAGAAAPTTLTTTSNTSYFQYVTRAKKAYGSAVVVSNISTIAAGTLTYAEVGIYKGPRLFGASPGTWTLGTMPALTRIATASMPVLTSTGRKATTVALTGLVLPGDDLWAVISAQFGTTQPTFTALADVLGNALTGTTATYRPSTGASPVTPTAVSSAIPLMAVQFT